MIRRASVSDATAIAQVHVASWQTTYAGIVDAGSLASLDAISRIPSWEKDLQDGEMVHFLAEDETSVLGFAVGGPIREPLIAGFDAELYAIYILHSAQRRGIGRALFRETATALQERGFKNVVVWVMTRNPTRAFYEKLGGVPVGKTSTPIAGEDFELTAYGWPDLKILES